jgi:hypothetical protein
MGKEVTTKNFVAKIDDLIASEKNPRKIGRKQYEALKKSLVEFPEMKQLREIIIDEDNEILAGHQRIYALKDLGYEDVYVRQVFGLTQKQKDEFMIKDNVSAGEWDSDIIANLWDIDELEQFGVKPFKLPGGGGDGEEGNSYKNHEVTCPECGHHFELGEKE